jgi:hypothetical protein
MDSTAAAQMNSTAWTTLVNRIEYVLSGGLQLGALMLLSLPLCGHFCRRQWLALKGGGMAGSLLLYQLAQVGFLLPSLLYNGYTLWAWLGLGAQFSVPAMFWLGVWPQAANLVVSNAMCFLALDRLAPFGISCHQNIIQLLYPPLAHFLCPADSPTVADLLELSQWPIHSYGQCGPHFHTGISVGRSER